MPGHEHQYTARVVWTGNRGAGTASYRAYDRNWSVQTPGKPVIHCSNDPLLGGDRGLHNPEDMLIAALSACHMLWYLHLASDAGIAVQAYVDDPLAVGETTPDGAGRFLRARCGRASPSPPAPILRAPTRCTARSQRSASSPVR